MKKKKPITNPDLTNEDPEYWEKVLKSHNLSMTRGYNPDFIAYVGDLNDLEKLEIGLAGRATGKVVPKGHGPDC